MKFAEIIQSKVSHTCAVSTGALIPPSFINIDNEDPAIEKGWHYVDGVFNPPTQEELDAEAAEQAEQAETATELNTSTFATVTIAQAEQYIKNNFDTSQFDIDSITDLESARAEMRKMVIGFERTGDALVKVARMLTAMWNRRQ